MVTTTVVVAVAAMVVGGSVACSSDDSGPRATVTEFVDDVAAQKFTVAAGHTDSAAAADAALKSAWAGLQATGLSAAVGKADITGDTASVNVDYHWTLPQKRSWTYSATLEMARTDGGWQVRWSNAAIHPQLSDTQTLALESIPAETATVNESDGSTVLASGTVEAISIDVAEAADAGGVAATAAQLTQLLAETPPGGAPVAAGLDPQEIAEYATAQGGTYPVTTISQSDYNRLADRLAAIPGVHAVAQAAMLPTDPRFAPDLISQVSTQVNGELTGRAGWRIVTESDTGSTVAVLDEHDPQPAPAVSISLSRAVQNAAQQAVNVRKDDPTMMVVIQPSTGRLLAVAQNALADAQGPLATTGLFPPGSTFKMVTSAAAFSAKLTTPDSIVGCPGEVTIGDRTVPNYDNFSLGDVPVSSAFAHSCNTTFAKLASEMGPSDLARTGTAMGIGMKYDIPGIPADTGDVPIATDLVSRTEDGFGQGKVLTSPLGLALVAATIDHGSLPVPQLILGRTTTVSGPHVAVSPQVLAQLRPMMREVVESGTATAIAGEGQVYGKTGEAEIPGASHAWFAGYRGDLAFATLVVRGGSSDNAVLVTRDFFDGLPEGYGQ